jgi:hypothetical protein
MKTHANESRLLWLLCGVVGGLCLAYFWPHEELRASATDHSDKFAICTVEVAPLTPEAVFVLNFTTGELRGALLNSQTGGFTNYWIANVAQDFQITGKGDKTKYVIIPGTGFLAANNQQPSGGAVAAGVLYVGELSSGMVGCYRFHYSNTPVAMAPQRMEAAASFQFYEKK